MTGGRGLRSPAGAIRVGVGGWTFEPWRGAFYPPGLAQRRELEFASRALTTIEINATFYRGQTPATFDKWRDETPDDFVFAVKGSRFVTNRRVLAEAGPALARFFETGVTRLGKKLGPINWQLAATKRFEPDDMAAFLALLPNEVGGVPLRHAIEARHESFRTRAFVEMARARGVAVVVAGDCAHPLIADLTAPFVYMRVMGSTARRAKGYAPADIERWAAHARSFARGSVPDGFGRLAPAARAKIPRDVFVYFIAGAKERNPLAAMALIQRLRLAS